MAWISLGGKSRQFKNTETGEILSRRQYDKLVGRIVGSYEKKAKENKLKNLEEALARPAPGRTKAVTEKEKELRAEIEKERLQIKAETAIEKKAKKKANATKIRKIRPQLLETGKKARRIPFLTYEQYENYVEQMRNQRMSNGRRLIYSYGIGIYGYRTEDGETELTGATLTPQMTPSVLLSKEKFTELSEDFLLSKSYFTFISYYLHLHFDDEYSANRLKQSNLKNLRVSNPLKKRK